jgi:hypothetical protein
VDDANGISGDFTVVDTAILNRYFREYYLKHGHGGTHTQQRSLIQLFNFLERERGLPGVPPPADSTWPSEISRGRVTEEGGSRKATAWRTQRGDPR